MLLHRGENAVGSAVMLSFPNWISTSISTAAVQMTIGRGRELGYGAPTEEAILRC